MTFEAGKEYRTRDGHRARIYATDAGGEYPIHGAFLEKGCATEEWSANTWRKDGSSGVAIDRESPLDLMPPTRTVWVVVWVTRGDNALKSAAFPHEAQARDLVEGLDAFAVATLPVDVPA